jgi:dTDP-4-amino-4,6-dideoxygalactose transaminase
MPGSELINTQERDAVVKIFDDGGVLFAHGNDVKRSRYAVREFEAELSRYFGSKYVQCASSGSSATYIALKSLGIYCDSGSDNVNWSYSCGMWCGPIFEYVSRGSSAVH